jgi:exodeoxyribonuclease-3
MKRTLCTLNVNGIRAAAKRGLADWIDRRKPDRLCLQEVRAQWDQVPAELRAPAGYETRWLCAQKKGYSGVALYSRQPADKYKEGAGIPWADTEGRVLRGDYGAEVIVSAYVPSGSSSEERQAQKFRSLDALPKYMRALMKLDRPVAVCGDINIAHTELDIHAPKRNSKSSGFLPEERAWFTQLLAQGWVDVVRAAHPAVPGLYSWCSARGEARAKDLGWRIDYVLMNPQFAERVTGAWIEKEANLSDHPPVWVEYEAKD